MKRLAWALGYLWMAPLAILGALIYLTFKALGWIVVEEWNGPARLVYCQGPLADALWRRNWYGHTMGPFCFFWAIPGNEQIKHETRHVTQQMVLGVFHVVVYFFSMLAGLVRYGTMFESYRHCVLERDARHAAGED